MTTVQYPSPVVPGPPEVTMDLPAGWEQVWAPDTLIAVRRTDSGDGSFLANIVVRFYQRLAPFGPDEIAAELADYAASRGGEVGPLKDQTVGGRQWVGADLAYDDGRVGTVGQCHWFTAAAQNDVMDVVQVTASWDAERVEVDYPVIDAALDSLRLGA